MTDTFEALRLNPLLLQALKDEGYKAPTPIQAQAIPAVMEGRDLLGIAQTGTGKTAAFALPLLHKLALFVFEFGHEVGPAGFEIDANLDGAGLAFTRFHLVGCLVSFQLAVAGYERI